MTTDDPPLFCSSPFPADVAYVWAGQHGFAAYPLHAGERALLGMNVADGRLQEFRRGRGCAHAALAALGVEPSSGTPEPILRADGKMPRWPAGVVASLTHTRGWVAASAASDRTYVGIGLDLEVRGRFRPQLARRILRPEEQEPYEELSTAAADQMGTLIFSAKECIYKALYPATGVYLGFQDAAIDQISPVSENTGTFGWTLHRSCTAGLEAGYRGIGAYEQTESLIMAAVWVIRN